MNQDHCMIFETALKYCISDCSFDFEGHSISSKGSLPSGVDIMVIWIKFTHSHSFSSPIPMMPVFTLVISCLTMSNLSWFMDLTFQILMQYYSIQHQTFLSPLDTYAVENLSCFGLTASLFLELLLIALFPYPVAYWKPSDLGGSSSGVISFCLFILSWVSPGRNTGVDCHFPFQGTMFFRALYYDPPVLGGLSWHVSFLHWVSPFATTRLCSIKGF